MACLAYKGFNVICVDLNEEIVEQINHGIAPFPEPQLQMMIQQNREKITATTKIMEAIPKTDMAFIRVATPSNHDGRFSSEYVETAVAEICRVIPDTKEYYTIVNTSTVMPGTMEEIIKPLVEQTSNRATGKHKTETIKIDGEKKIIVKKRIGLCYMPDWVALGSIIDDILNPDVILMGESDKEAGDILSNVAGQLVASPTCKAKIHRMNFYNAETAKLANNNYISMKISFTNTIMEYCEKIPGGDAVKVLDAIGDDSRIGHKYLKPGLGYGGFCFPRDQKAFICTAIAHGIHPMLAHATDRVNDEIPVRIADKIAKVMKKEKAEKLAFLGITYKPDVSYTKESSAEKILDKLMELDIIVETYDPSVEFQIGGQLNIYNAVLTIEDCLKDSQIVFIGTPWKQFRDIDKKLFKNKTVIDSFGILKDKLENQKNIKYIRLGKNYEES